MLVDVHCHLDHKKLFNNLDEIIKRCREKKLIAITSGINPSSNRKALEISEKYKDVVKASLGLYPIDALNIQDIEYPRKIEFIDIEKELDFIKKNKEKIIAIGEVGLDAAFIKDKMEKQKDIFLKIIELAEKIKKPLIVHSRKAEREAIEILESSKLKKVVMHCFSGNFKLVKRIENNGWTLSIPVNIIKSLHFQGIVNLVPISQLLTETDAPYLSPPNEIINEPIFVEKTIEKISEIKKLDKEEIKKIIFMNYQKMFLK